MHKTWVNASRVEAMPPLDYQEDLRDGILEYRTVSFSATCSCSPHADVEMLSWISSYCQRIFVIT